MSGWNLIHVPISYATPPKDVHAVDCWPLGRVPRMSSKSLRLFGWHISAYLGLSWLISSHKILFILPAEHYSFYQPNTLVLSLPCCMWPLQRLVAPSSLQNFLFGTSTTVVAK
jgi:hypothetical protein